MISRYIHIFIAVALSTPLSAQVSLKVSKECKHTLRKLYAAQNGENLKEGKGIEYSYNTSIVLHDKTVEPIPVSKTKMTAGKNRMYLQNDLVELYQDEANVIIILHNVQQIVVTSAMDPRVNQSSPATQNQVMDTIIALSKILQYENTKLKGREVTFIKLEVPEELVAAVQAEKIGFWIDEEAGELVQTTLWYPKYHDIDTQTNTFYNRKHNIKLDSKPVNRKVFDQDGNVLEKYRSYKLIDNRG